MIMNLQIIQVPQRWVEERHDAFGNNDGGTCRTMRWTIVPIQQLELP
jgi:hypothetical protein